MPTGKFGLALSNNRWFGVSGSRSFGSLLTGVKGRLFKIPWTSVIMVLSISSEKSCCPSNALRILRMDRMIRSQAPPICDAESGLNFQMTFLWRRNAWIDCWFQSSNDSPISFSPARKFVPLSLHMVVGFPLRLINLRNALMKPSVSSEWTT